MRKIVGIVFTLLIVFSFATQKTKASEGQFELKNQVGESARCWAASILMQDLKYQILVSCRDILYPGGTEVFSYVVWANEPDGGTVKLGSLGLGKVQFESRSPFVSLYVTKEINERTRNPQGPIVMSGGLQRISLLDNPDLAIDETSELGESEAEPTPSPTPTRSTGTNLLRIGGVAAFILIFLVVMLILVITRR